MRLTCRVMASKGCKQRRQKTNGKPPTALRLKRTFQIAGTKTAGTMKISGIRRQGSGAAEPGNEDFYEDDDDNDRDAQQRHGPSSRFSTVSSATPTPPAPTMPDRQLLTGAGGFDDHDQISTTSSRHVCFFLQSCAARSAQFVSNFRSRTRKNQTLRSTGDLIGYMTVL